VFLSSMNHMSETLVRIDSDIDIKLRHLLHATAFFIPCHLLSKKDAGMLFLHRKIIFSGWHPPLKFL